MGKTTFNTSELNPTQITYLTETKFFRNFQLRFTVKRAKITSPRTHLGGSGGLVLPPRLKKERHHNMLTWHENAGNSISKNLNPLQRNPHLKTSVSVQVAKRSDTKLSRFNQTPKKSVSINNLTCF